MFFLLLIVLLIVRIFAGLKILSRPQTHTEEEFERGAAENKTMLGTTMNALQIVLDSAEAGERKQNVVKARTRQQEKDLNEEDND